MRFNGNFGDGVISTFDVLSLRILCLDPKEYNLSKYLLDRYKNTKFNILFIQIVFPYEPHCRGKIIKFHISATSGISTPGSVFRILMKSFYKSIRLFSSVVLISSIIYFFHKSFRKFKLYMFSKK